MIGGLLLGWALLGCGGDPAMRMTGHDPLPASHPVSGRQAIQLVLHGALLVDVSAEIEFYGRHLRGAYNVPWDELEQRHDELPRDRPLVIYSRDGAHTEEADLFLRARGYDVHVLGHFAAWSGS